MSTPLDDDSVSGGDLIEAIHISQLFPIVEALEKNQTNYREDIGLANAYKVDFSGSGQPNEIPVYQAGQQIVFKAANANTGASTLQVVGPLGDLTAVPLTKNGGGALMNGDIQAGQIVIAIYNDEGTGRFDALGVLTGGAGGDGSEFYREDDGSANAYQVDGSGTGSNPLVITSYAPGQVVVFKAANANTGASTLQVVAPGGALTAKSLTKFGNTALEAGDIQANQMVVAIYNDAGSGRFEMIDAPQTLPEPPEPAPPEDGTGFFREDEGSANAYEVNCSGSGDNPNVVSGYSTGLLITFKASNENTGASTLEVMGPSGSLGSKDITKFGGTALEAGDIQADQIVMAVYNDVGGGRFEMMDAPTTIPEGGGGGVSFGAVASQAFRSSDLQIFATTQTDLTWQSYDIDEDMDAYDEWLVSEEDGFYEVSLCLNMDFPVDDTLTVEMFKGDIYGHGNFSLVELDVVAGLQLISLPPMLVELNAGQRIKWMLTSANGDPTVLSGDRRSRCTINQIGGGSGSSSSSSGSASSWLYGDGMDGNEYFNSDQDLWEHKYYHNLHVDYGASLCTNGYKLHVSGTLTCNGVIHNNGTDGSAAVGSTPGDPGYSNDSGQLAWGGHPGGAGGLQDGESVYSIDEQTYFARGGNGGSGSYNGGGSGDGGNSFGNPRFFMSSAAILSGLYDGDAAWTGARNIGGGMGGGGGTGNDDDAAGGGGGSGGSILWIAARTLAGDGDLQAKGGNGGAAGGTDAGGGGGGGGGIIYLLTDATSSPYVHSVDGGSGGAGGGGAGTDGNDGDEGLVVFRGA
ncbi:hypothetical protein ABS71_04295 [bacterium SCN 62-11]|nr:MAG: hypothetical protein ABS71_04295 [bacterium SCN 62-11]